MTRTFFLLLTFLLFLSACGPAPRTCTDPLGCLELPPGAPIVVGVLAALSGPESAAGTKMLAAVQSAAAQTGPLSGHEVELIWEATDCTEGSARLAADRLVRTADLLAVIGPSCPADAPFAFPALEDAGVALLAPALGGDRAFLQLVEAIQKIVVLEKDGSLSIPRAALQDAIKYQP